MGFKTKIFLLAIVAALIGYIWYFHVEFSQNTIVFTVAIVLMFLIDWAESNPAKPRSFTPKIILFVILAALIFYVWYFDVSFNQDVISFFIIIGCLFIVGYSSKNIDRDRHPRSYRNM